MKSFIISLTILLGIPNHIIAQKYKDNDALCSLLGKMTVNDQKYRGLTEMENPFFRILDSLQKAKGLSLEEYAKLSQQEQLEWGKRAKAIATKVPRISQKKRDSLMQFQIELDNQNTAMLIDIINERGWISKNGLGCEEYVSPSLIFRHSQEEYWDEIRIIIEREKAKNTIGKGDYLFIDDHITGRTRSNILFKKS